MKKQKVFCVLLVLVFFVCANVYAAGKGGTPNGKPFIELNGQIVEVEGELSTISDQVDALVARVDSIENRIAANESAIADLQAQNDVLQTQIDTNATDVASIEGQIADLEAENADLQALIDGNAGDIDTLQGQINTNDGLITALSMEISTLSIDLQAQITNNNVLISNMNAEIVAINGLLAAKQDIIDGNCPPGESIREVNADGSTVCEIDDIASEINSVTVSQLVSVPASTYGTAVATCPEGAIVSGGGFIAYPEGSVISSLRNGNGWDVYGYNSTEGVSFFIATATCISIAQLYSVAE